MNKIFDILIALAFIILLSPLIIIPAIIEFIYNYFKKYKLKKFIKKYSQKVIYLYSSKKIFYEYNETLVLPNLSSDILIVYNNKGELITDLPKGILILYLKQVDKIKHPIFIKIINDKAIAISIHDEISNLQNKVIDEKEFLSVLNLKLERIINSSNGYVY